MNINNSNNIKKYVKKWPIFVLKLTYKICMVSYNLFAIESHGDIRLLSKYGKKNIKISKMGPFMTHLSLQIQHDLS